MNYLDFPQEFDWCLHLWQKKSLETVSDVDKPLQEASHFQFIRARDGPEGISCLDEQLLLKKYCDNIDDCNSSGGNHADLIMPVIKNTTADCLKWEYSSLDPLMKALEKSKNVPMKHSFIPSSEALKDIAAGFVEAANTVSSEPHSTNCHISNASDEGKENSRLNVDGGSSSAAYRFTGNPKVLPSASIDSDQSPLGAQQIISNLEQRPDSFIAQRPKTFTSTDDVCRNNYSFKSGRVQNVLKTPSFDLIENSNADFIGGDSKRSRPPEELPRNTQIFGSQQINNESAYHGRGVYPWQAHADRAGPGLKKESGFRTASYQLKLNQMKQGGRGDFQGGYQVPQVPSCPPDEGPYGNSCRVSAHLYGNTERRSLGTRPGSVSSKFIPPVRRQDSDGDSGGRKGGPLAYSDGESNAEPGPYEHLMMDPRLKNIDSKMVELIMNEVLDAGVEVQWDDIAGLQEAKATIQEVVVWPMLRPDIFTGLRGPPKGVLLFGPPGTGKTMIGKAIASQSGATFFSISASCLTSKWVGEGEKMVRALFAVARVKSPSVIFIDEVDSLLCQRSDTEHESSRRIKTEFLVQLDGVGALTEQVLVVGATNRPHELDEAARRRLVKRLYIPLPDLQARRQLVEVLLSRQQHTLTPSDVAWVANNTDGFSGADMASLCSEAAMGPVRDIDPRLMRHVTLDQVRPISITDFRKSVANVRPSVCQDDLELYTQWNAKYGISRALV